MMPLSFMTLWLMMDLLDVEIIHQMVVTSLMKI